MRIGLEDINLIIYDEVNDKSMISIKIDSFSDEIIEFINKNIIRFYDGRNSYYKSKTIFQKIHNHFIKKMQSNLLYGAIAEFLLLIIFTKIGYAQEYCYQDLEGDGIKKGFDGLFMYKSELWLMESKSSYKIDLNDMTHRKTINLAYSDMKLRIEGSKGNDPWQNALNHAKAASSDKGLLKNLTELSEKFSKGVFGNIKDENIILGSTIYHEKINDIDNSKNIIERVTLKHTAKKQITVAINLPNTKIILDLIEGLKNE